MQINKTITITAGTPIQIETDPYVSADTILIQMASGSTGVGYVMDGIAPGRTPATTNSSDLSAELAPAGASGPGGSWSKENWRHGIFPARIWVDGTHSGDKMHVSYDQRV